MKIISKSPRPKVITHSVIEINQHDIIEWLIGQDRLSKDANRDLMVEALNGDLMKYLTDTMCRFLMESGAYDKAMNEMVNSGYLESFMRQYKVSKV